MAANYKEIDNFLPTASLFNSVKIHATVSDECNRTENFSQGWHHFSCHLHHQIIIHLFLLKLIKHFFALFYKHIVCFLLTPMFQQCLLFASRFMVNFLWCTSVTRWVLVVLSCALFFCQSLCCSFSLQMLCHVYIIRLR